MIDSSPKYQTLRTKLEKNGLHYPKTLTVGITGLCNLSCDHCWLDCGPEKIPSHVSPLIVKRLIGEFVELEGNTICFSGGEPLSHPDWFELLRYACSYNNLSEIRLQTNATLIGNREVLMLKSLKCNRLIIEVSLDGVNPETHDLIRGKGSFEKAMNGIECLAFCGLNNQIHIHFTEMKHNFDDFPDLLRMAHRYGIPKVISSTLVKAGRAEHNPQMLIPEPSQYRALLNLYHRDDTFRSLYDTIGNSAALEWMKGRDHSSGESCTCIENLYLNAKGDLYPCILFQADSYASPGAHHRSLLDSLLESINLWSKLPAMHRLRSNTISECVSCKGLEHCQSGCMGRAQATYYDPYAKEDRCLLRKTVYDWQMSDD